MLTFLQQLRVDWPAASERASSHTLRSHALEEVTSAHDGRTLSPGILGRLCLKELVEEQGRTAGYDSNLDNCLGRTCSLARPEKAGAGRGGDISASCQPQHLSVLFAVTEDLLSVLAELQEALWHWPEDSHPGLVSDSQPCRFSQTKYTVLPQL